MRGRSLRDIALKRLASVGGPSSSSSPISEDDNVGDAGAADAAGGGVGAGRLPLEKPNDVRSTMAFFVGVVLVMALPFLEGITMVFRLPAEFGEHQCCCFHDEEYAGMRLLI